MTTSEAFKWCRAHNARVRFESNGTVSVYVNGFSRRRATLTEAVVALELHLAVMPSQGKP